MPHLVARQEPGDCAAADGQDVETARLVVVSSSSSSSSGVLEDDNSMVIYYHVTMYTSNKIH